MPLFPFREPFSAGSHGLWLVLSVPATLYLWHKAGGEPAKRLSLLVFGLSLASCYLGSMLYHGVRVGKDRIDLYDRLDHIGIYLLIAGSYTPVAWNLMSGAWRRATLWGVWAATAAGCLLLLVNVRQPFAMETCEYLALGWAALICYVHIARVLPRRAMRPLVAGGVCYSVGAVLNLAHWPNLWPGVIGFHEVFHLWVMAGSLAHFWFMLTAVVPFAVAEAEAVPVWAGDGRRPPRTVVRVRTGFGPLDRDP